MKAWMLPSTAKKKKRVCQLLLTRRLLVFIQSLIVQLLLVRSPPGVGHVASQLPCGKSVKGERQIWERGEMREIKELRERTQPPRVVCKVEAQLEYAHIAYTFFFARSAPIRMLSWCILTKISVSELSLLRVSCWLGNLVGEERPDINWQHWW